jgi:hypothetical protein
MKIDSRKATSEVGTKVEEASSSLPFSKRQTNFDAKEKATKI